jgi:hypothetical protein
MFLPENMELIDMNPLTEPYLIADAIENERQVPESKTNRYPGDFKITDMENIDKAKSYFDCMYSKTAGIKSSENQEFENV